MLNQYIFLKEQSVKLLTLQRDYAEHLSRLNAIISDFQKNTETDEESLSSSDEKKNTFLVVNRSPEHLDSAVEKYLKKNNLSKELRLLKKNRATSHELRRRPITKRYRRSSSRISRRLMLDIPRQIEQDISFSWPIDLSCFWISSYFGPRKKLNGSPGFHSGVDLAAPRGTIVKAASSGDVVEAGYLPGYGNTIVIRHTKKYRTRYAHLNSINVKNGDIVERGQKIGRVGNTGHVRSAGGDASHLHFEVMVSNRKINPLWILPKIS